MRIERALQIEFPAALFGQRRELVLANNVRGKPVRVRFRLLAGVSENINLAMRLFERLRDLMRFEPAPPVGDDLHVAAERMPETHAGFGRKPIEWTIIKIHEFAVVPDALRVPV